MSTTITLQISAGANDGILYGSTFLATDVVAFGKSSGSVVSNYLLFLNATIPVGATITAAKLQYLAKTNQTGTTVYSRIYGNNVDDATAPTSAGTYAAKALTTAYVDWDSVGSWTAGTWYDSPDITTVIQEIVDRVGWASGNDILILHKDDGSSDNAVRVARPYEDGSSYPAKLVITYTIEYSKELTANVTISSSRVLQTGKNLTANVSVSSSFVKQIAKILTATTNISGSISRAITKTLSATVSITSSAVKQTSKYLSSAISIVSSFVNEYSSGAHQYVKELIANVVISSSAVKQTTKTLTANVSVSSSATKQIAKILVANISVLSSNVKAIAKTMIANIVIASVAIKQTAKSLTASVNITGSLVAMKVILKELIANVTISSSVTKQTGKNLTANISISSSVLKAISKTLTALVVISGLAIKSISKTLIAQIVISATSVNTFVSNLSNKVLDKFRLKYYSLTHYIGNSILDGDAIASEVLAGKTFYSNDTEVKLTGSMVNVGAQTATITAVADNIVPTQGYHNGAGSISIAAADQAKMIAENFKDGVTILGVLGTLTGSSSTLKYGDGSLNGTQDGYTDLIYRPATVDANGFVPVSKYTTFARGNVSIKTHLYDLVSAAASVICPQTPDNPSGSPEVMAVANGTNTFTLDSQVAVGKFCCILFVGINYTSAFNIGAVKLIFAGSVEKDLDVAVSEGYIEPMVLISSYHTEATTYRFTDALNVYTGDTTDTKNYSRLMVGFVTKQILYGYKFTTNKAWSTSYADGVLLKYCDADEGYSLATI